MTGKKKYRGTAKVEFLACKPDIDDKLSKGYSLRMLYDELFESKKISVGYHQFCRYVRGKDRKRAPKAAPVETPPDAAPRAALPMGSKPSASTPVAASVPAPCKVLDLETKEVVMVDGADTNGFLIQQFRMKHQEQG